MKARRWFLLGALVVSIGLHAVPSLLDVPGWGDSDVASLRAEAIEAAEAEAPAELGVWLIDAALLDARDAQEGELAERDALVADYRRRVTLLKDAGGGREGLRTAFGDMHLAGVGGDTLLAALRRRGGSSEGVSQLIIAALHDAGFGESVRIHVFSDQLAPVYDGIDLWTGAAPPAGAAVLRPRDLVAVYRDTHAPKDDGVPSEDAVGPPFAWRYPVSEVAHPPLPLFRASALQIRPQEQPACPVIDRLRWQPEMLTIAAPVPFEVERYRVPTTAELDAWSAELLAIEQRESEDGLAQLTALGCASATYTELSRGLAVWSQPTLSHEAAKRSAEARVSARELIEGWSEAERAAVARALPGLVDEAALRLLWALPAADSLVVEAALPAGWRDVVAPLLALSLSHPRSRGVALDRLAALPAVDRLAAIAWLDDLLVERALSVGDLGIHPLAEALAFKRAHQAELDAAIAALEPNEGEPDSDRERAAEAVAAIWRGHGPEWADAARASVLAGGS